MVSCIVQDTSGASNNQPVGKREPLAYLIGRPRVGTKKVIAILSTSSGILGVCSPLSTLDGLGYFYFLDGISPRGGDDMPPKAHIYLLSI